MWTDSADLRECLSENPTDICACEPLYPALVEAAAACSALLPSGIADLINSSDELFTNTCDLDAPAIDCNVEAYTQNATAYSGCVAGNPTDLCTCRGAFDALLDASFECLAEDLLPPPIEDNLRLSSAFYRDNCAPDGATVEFSSATYSYTPPDAGTAAPASAYAVTLSLVRTGDLRTPAATRVSVFVGGDYTGVSVSASFDAVSAEDGGADSSQTVDVSIPLVAASLTRRSVSAATALLGSVNGVNTGPGDVTEATIAYDWGSSVTVVYPSASVVWAAADGVGGSDDARRVTVVLEGDAAASRLEVALMSSDGLVAAELGSLAAATVAQSVAGAPLGLSFELPQTVDPGNGYYVQVVARGDDGEANGEADDDDGDGDVVATGESEPFTVAAAGSAVGAVEFLSWSDVDAPPQLYAGDAVALEVACRAASAGSLLVVEATSDAGEETRTVVVLEVTAVGGAAPLQHETLQWTVPHAWGVAGASRVTFTVYVVEGDGSDLYAVQARAAPVSPPYVFTVLEEWGECSTTCGQGSKVRDVECRSARDGSVRADRLCELYAPPASRSTSCYPATCSVPAGFGAVGDWSRCSRPCGGGVRERELQCLDQNGDPALPAACTGIQVLGLAPPASEPCNEQECEVFAWETARWRGCSAEPCGDGFRFRDVSCVGSLGNVDESGAACASPQPAFAQPCEAACFAHQWRAGDWSACAAPCGGAAVATRDVQCVDTANGNAVVDDSFCSPNNKPLASRTCNTGLCADTPHWESGPWSACTQPCGGGTGERSVQCVDDAGAVVEDAQCADSGAKPAAVAACNAWACDPCEGIDCYSPNGECIDGVCVCREGFFGGRCASTAPCALAAADGECCASGVVDTDGACCAGDSPVLDKDGACCASGVVDGCGVCDGLGFRDVRGECCPALAAVDASGICCASGSLDACGVCDGSATTCALHATADVAAPAGASTLALYEGSLDAALLRAKQLPAAVAAVLGVDAAAVAVVDVRLAPAADADLRRRALLGGSFASLDGAPLRVTFAVDNGSPIEVLLTHLALAAADAGSGLQAVTGLGTAGVCGNDVCEAGEACVAQADGATLASGGECCPADCPLVALPCPVSPPGPGRAPEACGGAARGFCTAATGECACYGGAGYGGDACDECVPGFTRVRGACVPVFSVVGQPTVPDDDGGASGSGSGSGASQDDGSGVFVGADDDPTPVPGSGNGNSGSGNGGNNDPNGQQTQSGVGSGPGEDDGGIGAGYIVLILLCVAAAGAAVYKLVVVPRRRRSRSAGMQRIESMATSAEMHGLAPSHEVDSVSSSGYAI